MKLNNLSRHVCKWLNADAPMSDIVISSRIRLARNLSGHKFISTAGELEKQQIVDILKEAICSLKSLGDIFFVNISEHDQVQKNLLVERQLISRNLAFGKGPRGAVIAADELFAAQINEEDHLRLSVFAAGLDLINCWKKLNAIDDELSRKVEFAFDSRYGYLTACPTNVGTGIRVSVMLHLPALKLADELKKVFQAAKDMNLTVRGLFGEGTEAVGDFFQISNQVTLGINENEIVENFMNVLIPSIAEYERLARKHLLENDISVVEDKTSRALALLKNARLISSHEAMFLLSNLRMGIYMGLIKNISIDTINELFLFTQPAHLQMSKSETLDARMRDVLRAERMRIKLN